VEAIRLAVAGGEIVCIYAGRQGAPALVFLHGWTLDHRMWAPQMETFARDRFVLACDRRGFGASTAPPDLGREADDLIAVLDHFAIARATLVGMSQAGRVALDFALRFSERLHALVLQGAPASGVTPGPDERETIPLVEYAALARAGRLDEMKRLWRGHPLMRATAPAARLSADCILEAYTGRDLGAASYLRDLEPRDLARISAPALVITGARDTPWRRRAGDALARTLPNAERTEIAEAGHLCNLEQPDDFNRALSEFLARVA
jgi:pimeloyl-ACP methyl ester carboxylesterase